jgi:uncharacterized membrane protein
MTQFIAYISALIVFIAIDAVWLGTMSKRLYKPTLGDILLTQFSIAPALAFYLLYPIGLVIFAISPAVKTGSLQTALIYGALFGLFTYGTYDLTNQATVRNWTTQLTLIDMTWGGILGGLTAGLAFAITTRFAA